MPDTEQVNPAQIELSEHNPRQVFDAADMGRLRESIEEVGILVPLTVYRTPEGALRLIDGERRLRCALELGLTEVPCYVVNDVDETKELKWMFSIHMLREEWEDGPVAKALRKLEERLGGWEVEELRAITGLSPQKLTYYKALADQPDEILDRVIGGELPPNLIVDSVLRVANPLRAELPDVAGSRTDSDIVKAMIEKREAGNLKDIVALRSLRTMIKVASDENQADGEAEELRGAITKVIDDPNVTIEETYRDTVETRIAGDEFQKATERFLKSARHAVRTVAADPEASGQLVTQLHSLIAELQQVVEHLSSDGR